VKSALKSIAKAAGIIFILFIFLIAALILFGVIKYGTEYVGRVLAWRESSYNVYMDGFPSKTLQASEQPFYFDKAIDEERVVPLFNRILSTDEFATFLEENETQAFLVIEDDAIVYEKYLNGFHPDSLLTSYSVAKSFTSALIGAAIADGYINGVDDPITEYLPELAERDPQFDDITIRHLLLMAAGIDFQEMRLGIFNGDDPLSSYYPDQRKAALEFTDIIDPPGEYFRYNKYYPQLLGLIIERSTGMSVTDYMQQALWDPLGMQYDGSWSIDSEESGFEKMEAGLNARAVDFAKFGRLYLEDGSWNGEQVLPSDWIEDSTSVDWSTYNESYYPDEFGQLIYDELNGYYKYMWYGYFRGEDGFDFAAEGDRGQIIYVSPHKNLIIIRNGTDYGIPFSQWVKSLYEFASEF
jgi:CubicO group peptidase (beta-lactamase class C family)